MIRKTYSVEPGTAKTTLSKTIKAAVISGTTALSVAGAPSSDAQESVSGDSSRKLELVVVTAQRREESLQDVPISITAVTGDTLEKNGIDTFHGLAERTPNLRIQVADGGPATIIGIRGIASGFNRGFEQSVGLVVDGIYNSRGEYFRTGLIDVQRAEVLRGPQGTLFGKNATAGLINIITRDPTDEFEAEIKARLGTEDLAGGTAVVSGPIIDGLSGRLVLNYAEQDSYLENTGGGVDGGSYENRNIRLKLKAEPSDDLTLRFTYERLEREVLGTSQQVFIVDEGPNVGFFGFDPNANVYDPGNGGNGFIPLFGISSADFFTAFDPGTDFVNNGQQSSDVDAFFDTKSDNIRFQADWAIGDYTVTYLGGYIDLNDNNVFDPDFSASPYLVGPADVKSEQITHELRIESSNEGRLRWTAGLYKFDLEMENSPDASVYVPTPGFPPALGPIPGVIIPPALPNPNFFGPNGYVDGFGQFGVRVTQFEQETDAWAVFAQGTFDITDRLRITVGGRYTDEEKTSNQYITSEGGTIRTPDGDIGPPPVVVVNGVPVLNPSPAFFANTFDSTVVPYCLSNGDTSRYEAAGLGDPCGPGLKRSESNFTPMANLQYDFSDDLTGYVSWSRGFKGGGFNGQARRQASLEFEEETVEAYEIGFKSTLLDGSMTANVAAYLSNYEDFQTTQFVNQVFIVGNAAEVESKGIEADILWQATDNLRLSLSAAYTDVQYEKFDTAACTNDQLMALSPFPTLNGPGLPPGPSARSLCVQDLSGQGVELSPDFSGNVSAIYDLRLPGMPFDAQFGADVSYSGDYLLTQDLNPLLEQDAYALVNLRAALLDKDEKWELALLGQNVTDEIYLLTAAGVPAQNGAYFSTINRGRVVELQFNWLFN